MEEWKRWLIIENLKNKNSCILFFPLNSIVSNKRSCLILLSWHRDQEESKKYANMPKVTFALHFRVERPLISLILYARHCSAVSTKTVRCELWVPQSGFLSTSLNCSQHAQNAAFHQVDIIELIAFLKYFIYSKWMKVLGGCTMSTHTSRVSCLILKWLLDITY